MSKLSPALKALIAAPFAKPGPTPAGKGIERVYSRVASEAAAHKVGLPAWVTLCTGVVVTRNSPDALARLYDFASSQSHNQNQTTPPPSASTAPSSSSTSQAPPPSNAPIKTSDPLALAELIREIALKAICFNGVPRTINMLNAFHSSLPQSIKTQLRTTPSRTISPANASAIAAAGQRLWDSIYLGFAAKLQSKLADAHPDLPVHILFNEYGALLADSAERAREKGRVGRVLTSLAAVACLRAQTGVGPQVTSHVFGLRKSWDDGSWRDEGDGEGEGMRVGEEEVRFLASDEGGVWVLESTDEICAFLDKESGGEGLRAKL